MSYQFGDSRIDDDLTLLSARLTVGTTLICKRDRIDSLNWGTAFFVQYPV